MARSELIVPRSHISVFSIDQADGPSGKSAGLARLVLHERKLDFQQSPQIELTLGSGEAVSPYIHPSSDGGIGLFGALVVLTRVCTGQYCFRKPLHIVRSTCRSLLFQCNEGLSLKRS